jgi:hypothetical protein
MRQILEDSYLNRLLENIASKTALALLGVLGTGITIYAFFQKSEIDLRYEITANTNVLDFNADISKLEVFYDSTNLKQKKENLRIYTIKVINIGDKDIVKEFYDDNDPMGLVISSGKIIEKPEIIETSSDYIKRNLKLSRFNRDTVTFSQVIIESNEFFVLKILVLHGVDSLPQINSIGKVAGQKRIPVVNSADVKNQEPSFWIKTYQGNVWTQLVRLFSYFGLGVAIILIIVATSEMIDTRRKNKKMKNLIFEFKNLKTYEYTRMDDAIFDRYLDKDWHYLRNIRNLINDEAKLNGVYTEITNSLKSKEYRRYRRSSTLDFDLIGVDSWTLVNEMISDGFVIKEADKLKINQSMKESLQKFIVFLKERKEFEADERLEFPLAKVKL